MAGINALDRTALQRSVSLLTRELADIGGANTPEMKAAGNALARSIRKQLSVKAPAYAGPLRAGATQKFASSPPGSPPFRRSGRLYKSVGQEVVGGVRRVGDSDFVGRLLQFGVDADEHRKLAASIATARGRRRKRVARPRRISHLRIAARPFMERALDAAQTEMGDAFVASLKSRGR